MALFMKFKPYIYNNNKWNIVDGGVNSQADQMDEVQTYIAIPVPILDQFNFLPDLSSLKWIQGEE